MDDDPKPVLDLMICGGSLVGIAEQKTDDTDVWVLTSPQHSQPGLFKPRYYYTGFSPCLSDGLVTLSKVPFEELVVGSSGYVHYIHALGSAQSVVAALQYQCRSWSESPSTPYYVCRWKEWWVIG
jgi:hypothetical protein